MKTSLIRSLVWVMAIGILSTSCRTTRVYSKPGVGNSSSLPPGQAKKITGEKSARKYAPGQQHKN